jgi:hypothetical protein
MIVPDPLKLFTALRIWAIPSGLRARRLGGSRGAVPSAGRSQGTTTPSRAGGWLARGMLGVATNFAMLLSGGQAAAAFFGSPPPHGDVFSLPGIPTHSPTPF